MELAFLLFSLCCTQIAISIGNKGPVFEPCFHAQQRGKTANIVKFTCFG